MKKIYLLSLIALTMLLSANCAYAQTTYTKQIIIANGGAFSNPDDYVTVASYDPETDLTTEFATIFTQSVQDLVIQGNFAFVAAQDSIVKLNIDTYEKISSVSAVGVNKLAVEGNILVASFWYPLTENFVRTYSTEDLSLITIFDEITDEASGIMIKDGIALVAIPGAYGSTTGKIAALDIDESIVLSEDDYGDFYTNIGYFASWNNITTAFMTTAWGGETATAATFDDEGEILNEFTYDNSYLANLTGQSQNLLYAEINNGIGVFDLEQNQLLNATVVAPQTLTIAASVIDTINSLIYLTTSDFYSTGEGFIYNLNGDQVGSFDAGISAQAIAVDYRINTGINQRNFADNLNVFPNPATDLIQFKLPVNQILNSLIITDVSGKVVYNANNYSQVDISLLNAGLYFIAVTTDLSTFTGKFIKQ